MCLLQDGREKRRCLFRITLLAGTGKKGESGNGGPALETPMNEPHGVFVHRSGTLYIVDSLNNRVFRAYRYSAEEIAAAKATGSTG